MYSYFREENKKIKRLRIHLERTIIKIWVILKKGGENFQEKENLSFKGKNPYQRGFCFFFVLFGAKKHKKALRGQKNRKPFIVLLAYQRK